MSILAVSGGTLPYIVHGIASGSTVGSLTPSLFQYSTITACAWSSSAAVPVISRAGTLAPVLVRVVAASAQLPAVGLPIFGGVMVVVGTARSKEKVPSAAKAS